MGWSWWEKEPELVLQRVLWDGMDWDGMGWDGMSLCTQPAFPSCPFIRFYGKILHLTSSPMCHRTNK